MTTRGRLVGSDDVTLGNPFGPFVRGKEAVRAAGERAASNYRDGHVVGFERIATYIADGMACVVHRHADPITAPRAAGSVISR